MAIVLNQEVYGQAVGATYSGPASLVPWLLLEGYAHDTSTPASHISTTAVLKKDDPTLSVNRERPHQAFALAGELAVPVIASVVPATGLAAGGLAVKILGTGLIDVTSVTFGGTAIDTSKLDVVSDNEIRVVTPAHAAGAVNVVATDPDGTSTGGTAAFTYS